MLDDWATVSELRADHYTEGSVVISDFESLTSVDVAAHSFVIVFNRKAFTENRAPGPRQARRCVSIASQPAGVRSRQRCSTSCHSWLSLWAKRLMHEMTFAKLR